MKHVSVEHLLLVPEPEPVVMTRQEKLTHWAQLLRASRQVALFHGLEFVRNEDLCHVSPAMYPLNVFSLAMQDETLNKQGLRPNANLTEVLSFFDITIEQAHRFACNCYGVRTNEDMALAINDLASRHTMRVLRWRS